MYVNTLDEQRVVNLRILKLIYCPLQFRSLHDGVLHSISVYLSAIAVIAAWIAALVTFRVVFSQGKAKDHWDIWSWACYRGDSTANVPWKTLCIQQVRWDPPQYDRLRSISRITAKPILFTDISSSY